MKKGKSIRKEDSLKQRTIFCAECGEELELFGIDDKKINLEELQERHKRCKETGKFKGDKCAMLFIAESNEELFIPREDD